MKKPKEGHNWFFVDESGDPTFYNGKGRYIVGEEGCSPILMLGFVETTDPHTLRQAILKLQQDIVNDPYFAGVPSLKKTRIALHAKDDLPEIRYHVYKKLATLNYRTQFVVARKVEKVFVHNHKKNPGRFYDDLIVGLFERVLHRYEQNTIVFSKRGSRDRQAPLEQAIHKAIHRFETKWGTTVETKVAVQAQSPNGEPCLSIIDYMNWAVYRAYTRREMRFYNSVSDRVSSLIEMYDFQKRGQNFFNKRNPFDINKITPL